MKTLMMTLALMTCINAAYGQEATPPPAEETFNVDEYLAEAYQNSKTAIPNLRVDLRVNYLFYNYLYYTAIRRQFLKDNAIVPYTNDYDRGIAENALAFGIESVGGIGVGLLRLMIAPNIKEADLRAIQRQVDRGSVGAEKLLRRSRGKSVVLNFEERQQASALARSQLDLIDEGLGRVAAGEVRLSEPFIKRAARSGGRFIFPVVGVLLVADGFGNMFASFYARPDGLPMNPRQLQEFSLRKMAEIDAQLNSLP